MSFVLRIINVTQKDTGIYSCVLKDKSNNEMWRSGVRLLPGGLYVETDYYFTNISLIPSIKYQVARRVTLQHLK